ncbi:MAG: hypothetical protein HYX43_05935 [Burkholderiales bacterium]|nr:hypothetical protein [Burkholderiales bacterium]
MQSPLNPAERSLLLALLLAIAIACFGPTVAQFEHYHAFADQRHLLGLPCALDVLSNPPFALLGGWGLLRLRSGDGAQPAGVQRALATLFFAGLVLTALCSGWYHLRPDDAGLAIDRLGMVSAFAGLLGLAAADRISERAGLCTAGMVLALGPVAVMVWANSGNLLPWSVLQGGGMALIVVLALRQPVAGAWGMPLAAVITWYALAKVLELGDHLVFDLTQGLISGHTLKHIAAALAAWPVIMLMHNGAQARPWQPRAVRA